MSKRSCSRFESPVWTRLAKVRAEVWGRKGYAGGIIVVVALVAVEVVVMVVDERRAPTQPWADNAQVLPNASAHVA